MKLARRVREERGFTIIETMVATFLMAVAFLGLAGVHTVSNRAQSLGNNQGLATFIANQQIELMRRSAFADVVSLVDSVSVEGESFTFFRAVSEADFSKRVTVVVLWEGRMGLRQIIQTSVVSQITNP